ncbi:MAG: hypothetical protein QME85_03600 [Candidatus Saccharicenans sp.]|nr:hypothetical protein [Candidatus Saccharicenans sp.]
MKGLNLKPGVVLILNFGLWPVIHLIAGYVAARRPRSAFNPEKGIYRLRSFELSGKIYERIGVKIWKKWLPDLGDFFKPGFPKKKLRSRDKDYLQTFYLETCRAEYAHWLTMSGVLPFWLWNEWWAALIMLGYALAVNLPCIIVQRYNRGRLGLLFLEKLRKGI